MIVTDEAPSPGADAKSFETEGLVTVADYASEPEAWEHGLVPLAMGLPCWIDTEDGRHRLWVAAEGADVVGRELENYDRANTGWPPAKRAEPRTGPNPGAWRAALAWAAAAGAIFCAQGRWPELTEVAAMDARAVFGDGEWWRAFTALFLHGDLGHLLSNLAGGVFLFAGVLTLFGLRRGGALLALSATAANLLVAAVYYPAEYRSLGASTALFAALGLLTGRAARAVFAESAPRVWRAMLAPLGAGMTMLMLYGAGGGEARVDVPAHGAGFAVGLAAGFICAAFRTRPAAREDGV